MAAKDWLTSGASVCMLATSTSLQSLAMPNLFSDSPTCMPLHHAQHMQCPCEFTASYTMDMSRIASLLVSASSVKKFESETGRRHNNSREQEAAVSHMLGASHREHQLGMHGP